MINLKEYSSNGAFDEFISDQSKFRTQASKIGNLLNSLTSSELKDIHQATQSAIKSMGISFRVYDKNNSFEDRSWPLDFIPRIIRNSEWDTVSKGLQQRCKAINLFIEDCYNDQEFLKSGLMDPNLILKSPSFKKECIGMKLPYSVWSHISGTDLIRDKDGNFYVLEDNLRVPSGVSYMIENRLVMKKVFPVSYTHLTLPTILLV